MGKTCFKKINATICPKSGGVFCPSSHGLVLCGGSKFLPPLPLEFSDGAGPSGANPADT